MFEQKVKPTVVDVKNVSRIFKFNGKHTAAVNNISLRSSYGELLLILGPSGSGKTTLLTLIAGLIKPTSGNVFLFGKIQRSHVEMRDCGRNVTAVARLMRRVGLAGISRRKWVAPAPYHRGAWCPPRRRT